MTVAALAQNLTYAVELEPTSAEELAEAAKKRRMTPEALIVGVIEHWLAQEVEPYDDWSPEDVEAIEEGMAQLERGDVVSQDELMARLKAKYGG